MNDKSICTIYFSPVSVNQNESVCKHCHLDKKQRRFMAGGGIPGGLVREAQKTPPLT